MHFPIMGKGQGRGRRQDQGAIVGSRRKGSFREFKGRLSPRDLKSAPVETGKAPRDHKTPPSDSRIPPTAPTVTSHQEGSTYAWGAGDGRRGMQGGSGARS